MNACKQTHDDDGMEEKSEIKANSVTANLTEDTMNHVYEPCVYIYLVLYNNKHNNNRHIYLSSGMIRWQSRERQSTSLEALVTSGPGGV